MSYKNNWVRTLSESYIQNNRPTNLQEQLDEQMALNEELLSLVDALCEELGIDINDLLEQRKKSLLQKLTFGIAGRQQVPETERDLESGEYDWKDAEPDVKKPEPQTKRGLFSNIKQKLIGASREDDEALNLAKWIKTHKDNEKTLSSGRGLETDDDQTRAALEKERRRQAEFDYDARYREDDGGQWSDAKGDAGYDSGRKARRGAPDYDSHVNQYQLDPETANQVRAQIRNRRAQRR
jgi:hypothetical protein